MRSCGGQVALLELGSGMTHYTLLCQALHDFFLQFSYINNTKIKTARAQCTVHSPQPQRQRHKEISYPAIGYTGG